MAVSLNLNNNDWMHRLQKGQTFQSWKDLKDTIVDHGIMTERVIVTCKKDQGRMITRCKMNSGEADSQCHWSLRAILKAKTTIITITKCFTVHTCEAADHYKRCMHSNSDNVANKILDILLKNRQTRACSLRDTCQALVHPDIRYHTAHTAKRRCLLKIDGSDKDSFYLIPDHCRHILDRDSLATAKWSAPDNHFESLFVCPGACTEAYKHCRPLVAFDGTHTRSAYPQILLIATAIDPNNTVLMLAYCMVPTENPAEWLRFLRLLRDALPDLSLPGTVFVSDREKGLLVGVEEVFPMGYHAFCTWHLKDNIRIKFNKLAEKEFDALVYATTLDQYNRRLDRIKLKNADLYTYIVKTADPVHYSRAFFPAERWGHETSQHAESLNRAIKPQRMEVAFKQSNLLWDYMMRQHWEKKTLGIELTTPFPPNIMSILRKVEEAACHLTAEPSSETEVRITDSNQRQFLVQFSPEWKCSCGDWQDTLIPCCHAWRAMSKLKKRHMSFVSPLYSSDTFRRCYSSSIPIIMREDLQPNIQCGEPLFRRKRGRPSEKQRLRFQDEDGVRRPRKCGVCSQVGHDRRSCPTHEKRLSQGRAEMMVDDGVDNSNEDKSSPESDGLQSSLHVDETNYGQEEVDLGESQPVEDLQGSQPSQIGTFSNLLRSVLPFLG